MQKIALLFTDDLMQRQAQTNAARTIKGYGYTNHSKLVKEEISKTNIAISNLEVTLGRKSYRGYPAFSAPGGYLLAIGGAGFDVLVTANNHRLDRGKKGPERITLMLDSLQTPYAETYTNSMVCASYYPLLLERNGFRIILLNCIYGTNGIKIPHPDIVNYINRAVMIQGIEAAKALHSDVLTVYMYWGIEHRLLSNKEWTSLADWLLNQGVTHVIGSRPYVVQPMEPRVDTLTSRQNIVLYSLGNFIPNMSARKTDGGLLFKLELVKDSTGISVGNCGYGLIWAVHPMFPKKKSYVSYSAGIPTDSLSAEERSRLKVLINDIRELLRKRNRGIDEYTS